jgi:hydroxysqualene synthase
MSAADLASGKGYNDENFPVASFLVAPQHRGAIHAFYCFARAADDVSDSPTAAPEEKLAILADMAAAVDGGGGRSPEGLALAAVLTEKGISPRHPLDLLEAFRRDVTKLRYDDWDDLMDYCRYSAAPVGRFVLDVHGENEGTWRANDALCAALQVINHLQDCGKDRRELDRVYIPEDSLAAAGIDATALDDPRASPALRHIIGALARRTLDLLAISRPFAGQIRDRRLALEVAVIQTFAEDLAKTLTRRDPLSEPVHHGKGRMLALALLASAKLATGRFR